MSFDMETSLLGATRTSAMIALILLSASFFALAMGVVGLLQFLAEWTSALNLPTLALLTAVQFPWRRYFV